MNRSLRICYFICIVLLLASCSTTKFVPDGEYLLDKVEIVSDNRDYKSADLKSYLKQQPNFKVFGLMKWQLFVYDWSGKNEKNGSINSYVGLVSLPWCWIRCWWNSPPWN